jgi:hypothetical protein
MPPTINYVTFLVRLLDSLPFLAEYLDISTISLLTSTLFICQGDSLRLSPVDSAHACKSSSLIRHYVPIVPVLS